MFILLAALLLLLPGCTQGDAQYTPVPAAAPHEEEAVEAPIHGVWPALALIETGEHPLWFELGVNGPALIESPFHATLTPLTPWPHARFVVEIIPWERYLVMAVNLDGFFVLGPASAYNAGTRAVLYRVTDSEFWANYTVGAVFIWRDQPAALLYRHDFFTGLHPYSPQPQVFVLNNSSPVPLGAEVPALRPPGEGWEAETLSRGTSGYWYFRMRQKGGPRNQSAYFRARDLEGEGERISQSQWRASAFAHSRESPEVLAMLPALPEGFAYTGVAFLGEIVLATWEEQQGAGIGAAGFMMRYAFRQ